MRVKAGMIGVALALAVAGCTTETTDLVGRATPPSMRWDTRPEAAEWTVKTLMAVAEEDQALATRVPADIAQWCPGYEEASLMERRAFWVALISAVGKYESSYNPRAAGGGGKYIGIMQISPRSAANYGCDATSASALKDGTANLACAVEMVAHHVERDGVAVGNGRQGIGRDWMPFRKGEKRAEMANWVSKQTYCQPG
ncbi:transglycosylase SLT domain-containing protein [Gemmobacter fulvus]|uniref:transglycosylase SLT domain-containing protein n=1 Tax=Gemmobacter fulvus TaxID=2840474 RepID=UPI0027965D8D|nr:transglycosylase SLT domain-containing protein [Gemmobacter fulvus]MDQ1847653.1 transglycosylase SLT domain-containing protein [Gemmobacter fulvus]